MVPTLSVVVTGRNDDYGGDFHHRLQTSVRWWSHHVKEFEIPTEYVFVNWNPLPDKPSLFDTIEWYPNKYFEIKFVEVPYKIHEEFNKPEVRKPNQLYEFIAKNVGIRRATGKYILSTNADILCDPLFFIDIAGGGLQADTYFRANRFDYHATGITESDFEEELITIRKNIFEVKARGVSFPFKSNGSMWMPMLKLLIKNRLFVKWQLCKRKYHRLFTLFGCNIVYDNAEYHLHVNAAGDFLLMHSDHWHKLKGYDETFFLTLHNDAELVFNAYASGLKECVIVEPIYHQDHERRYSEVNPNLQQDGYKIYKQLQEKAQRLLKTKEPEIANDDYWGLKNHDLEIKRISFA